MGTVEKPDIIKLEETIAYFFPGDVERIDNITVNRIRREAKLGHRKRAVYLEKINPNGGPSGSYEISVIDDSHIPPSVLSVSVGSELGIQACESHDEAVADSISARQNETWHGYGTPAGCELVRRTVQLMNAPLYQM